MKSIRHITDTTNYGELSVYEIDGIRFVAGSYIPEKIAQQFKFEPIDVDSIPSFVDHMYLQLNRDDSISSLAVYVLDKKDLMILGEKFKDLFDSVYLCACARLLVIWSAGVQLHKYKLSHFYLTTPAEDEKYSYG